MSEREGALPVAVLLKMQCPGKGRGGDRNARVTRTGSQSRSLTWLRAMLRSLGRALSTLARDRLADGRAQSA